MECTVGNTLFQINANMDKRGDFEVAMEVAKRMENDTSGDLVIVKTCSRSGYIVMSSRWNHYKRQDWEDAYVVARGVLK